MADEGMDIETIEAKDIAANISSYAIAKTFFNFGGIYRSSIDEIESFIYLYEGKLYFKKAILINDIFNHQIFNFCY